MTDIREKFESERCVASCVTYLSHIDRYEVSDDIGPDLYKSALRTCEVVNAQYDGYKKVAVLQEENERLRKVIFEARDQIANSPVDCLGDGYTQDGQPYPIRDEMVHRFTQALKDTDHE